MTADREPINPTLDAMLRENSAETPPAHVDAAILAAAHRAVASAPRVHSRRHWRVWLPLGAAATVAAVVIGLQPIERQAPEATRPVTVPLGAATGQAAGTPDQSKTATAQANAQSAAAAKPVWPAAVMTRPSSSASPATPRRDEAAAETAAPPAVIDVPASARDAPRPASAQRASEAGVTSKQLSQDARITEAIERIRALRRDGREAEATAALAQLRETMSDADARLPPDLRDWASTVRR